MKRVLKETVTSGKGVVVTPQNRAVRENKLLKQIKVMFPNRVTNIDGTTRDGPGRSVKRSAGVSRLEHIPVRVYEIPHPQTVVRTVHHVTPLQPKRPVWVARRIRAPEVITCLIILICYH